MPRANTSDDVSLDDASDLSPPTTVPACALVSGERSIRARNETHP